MPPLHNHDHVFKICAISLAICLMSLKLRLCLILPLSFLIILSFTNVRGTRGGVVVKALRYKPVGRAFASRWCHWNFSLTYSFRSHYGPGVDSASNGNEYQVYFLRVKAAGA
jgi:hypothetical protein